MNEMRVFFEKHLQTVEKTHLDLIMDNTTFIPDLVIKIDAVRLRQVLTNLIDNAIKFTDCGFIRFGYRQSAPDQLEFKIEDTGIGLSPANHELIFERFRQVDENNDRKYGGTGLGLTISRSLVQLMGGEMWVESEEGRGSRFYFTVKKV